MTIREFIDRSFRHFNAATLKEAAMAYEGHLQKGGRMMVTLAGAMSTAELGVTLAEMIRRDKVHAITCTGANLEEDVFNLLAHNHYYRIPNWRVLTPEDDQKLYDQSYARVTDTCIPEERAMMKLRDHLLDLWKEAARKGEKRLPHEYFYELFDRSYATLSPSFEIDPKDSWLLEAWKKRLPLFVPGWEDSTLGNMFAAACIKQQISSPEVVKSGVSYMIELASWYRQAARDVGPGFFQIGGGIAGDFPICVVPMLAIDLDESPKRWGYFCQISDSTTSYGSYSGATPTEKITWAKLEVDTPGFIIESDATIVAPLIFAYILGQ